MGAQFDGLLTASGLAGLEDFSLGESRVSPAIRQIAGPLGQAVVEPRVMQVLWILSQHEGQVLTRDTLFQRCWGGVHVGDDSLNRAIGEARRAIRLTLGDGVAIETVPRTGYRLVVRPLGTGSVGAPVARPGAPAASGSIDRRILIGATAAIALGGAGAAAWTYRDPTGAQVRALIDQSGQASRSGLPDSDAQGAGLLREALSFQPDNTEVLGKLALALSRTAEYADPAAAAQAVAESQAMARRALARDPGQADALAALALLPPYFGDWLAAERRMRAVLRRHPDHMPTLDAFSFFKVSVGRARESALERLAFAPREPLHAEIQYKLIYAYWILDRIPEADRAADRALQLWPKHPGAWFGRLWVLAFTDRAERALAHVEDAAARPDLPDWLVSTLVLAMRALTTRRAADVERAADQVIRDLSRGPSLSINAVLILAGLGEVDQAFAVAEAYLLERGDLPAALRWRRGQVSVNDQRRRKTNMLFVPVTAVMRRDARFAVLTRDVGLSAYWRQAGRRPDHHAAG